jgi:hypothetical protein
VDRHATTGFAGRYLLHVEGFRRIPSPLNSELMNALSQSGQVSAFIVSLPSFYKQDRQEIPCFIHSSKIVNYYNAAAEDIPFIWQKIERYLT